VFQTYAYIGCRTSRERNARGTGIGVFGIDDQGAWHPLGVRETLPNPSYLTVDAKSRNLYAVHGDGSELTSLRIERDGSLTETGTVTTAGLNPVDVVLDPTERFLVVTNHLSDGVVVRHRNDDGSVGEIVSYASISGRLGPHRVEQQRVKPHQARFDRSGRRLLLPNKGSDTVAVLDFDPESGTLTDRSDLAAHLREGSGPRNVVVHPAADVAYVVCELDSTVCVLTVAGDGRLMPIQVVSCLPDDVFGPSRAASIVLSAHGRSLHVSNRGHDSVCTFAVRSDGRLERPRWTSSGGRTPRFACLDRDGSRLLVANEDSDAIVALRPAEPGVVTVTESPSPTCIAFARPCRDTSQRPS